MMAVTFLNMFRRGPGTYRDLTQDQDRDQMVCSDATSVELKPSTMEDGEVDGSFTLTQQNSNRKWCKIAKFAVVVIFFFIVGYLLGNVMPHKPDVSTSSVLSMAKPILLNTTTAVSDDDDGGNGNEESDEPTPRFADWSSITAALRQKLTHAALDETLINLSTSDHQAGSAGDHAMGQKVLEKFKGLGMNPWVDVHYVKLQAPSRENKVLIGSEEIANPMGYLSYSASGTKQGKVMYANYGRREDLENLQKEKMNLTDSIVLMRTGNISLAEKVANAARVGVAAVLIYREPKAESEVNTELYGQVHLGTGDPYTPGFPSFNHTQFPPASSSGLPKILAQTITAETARKIHQKMGGKNAPTDFMGMLPGVSKYTLGGETSITVTVKNDLVDTKIYNVFGIIKGFVDPDRYVVLGAQRDAFSHGFAKSTVGTSLLLELATAITGMVEDGFRPRRSIVFASWSGGDFGSIGSTEWLEGYLSSLNLRAFTYISLDSTVSGVTRFKASSSPLLYRLLKGTMDEVSSPRNRELSISQDFTISPWEKSVLEPMRMEDAAYPFLAFSGIPSVSFRFVSEVDSSDYTYFGTDLDTRDKLDAATRGNLLNVCESAAQMAGQMALRLVHDHILNLDVDEYTRTLRKNIAMIKKEITRVAPFNADASMLKVSWLFYAMGAYSRAASALQSEIKNSDLDVAETCRNINDRIMRVEHNLLSPYVSPKDVPFRHIIFGSGDYSVSALLDHLHSLSQQAEGSDADLFRNQFAFITWTIQSCANDLAGDIWILHND